MYKGLDVYWFVDMNYMVISRGGRTWRGEVGAKSETVEQYEQCLVRRCLPGVFMQVYSCEYTSGTNVSVYR